MKPNQLAQLAQDVAQFKQDISRPANTVSNCVTAPSHLLTLKADRFSCTLQPSLAPSSHFGRGKIQFCILCWEDLTQFCIRNSGKTDPSLMQSQTVSSYRKVWPRGLTCSYL